jgi:hypothetical protein
VITVPLTLSMRAVASLHIPMSPWFSAIFPVSLICSGGRGSSSRLQGRLSGAIAIARKVDLGFGQGWLVVVESAPTAEATA